MKIESENVGKPFDVTMSEEIPPIVDNLRFFAGAARMLEGRSAGEYMAGFTSFVRREPIGVAGLIAPWNYPLMMAVWKIGPALATGNTIVLKPSELTPLTAIKMAELAADLFPPGVFNVVTGDGIPVGDALVQSPDVGIVSLTGDVGTGKIIHSNASESLKRVHLELGGKAPVVVFDDADLESVVEWVSIAGYFNAGQDCTAATRVLVADKAYDKVLSDLVPAVEGIKVGGPFEDDVAVGSVISQGAAGACDRVRRPGQGRRRRGAHGRQGDRPRRLLLRAHGGREPEPGFRDHPTRGVRPGRDRAAVHRRGPGARVGQRRRRTASRRRCGPATSAARCAWPASSSSGASGSTRTSR